MGSYQQESPTIYFTRHQLSEIVTMFILHTLLFGKTTNVNLLLFLRTEP